MHTYTRLKRVGHSDYGRRTRGAYGSEGYNRYTVEELTRPYEVTANLVGAIYLPVYTVHIAMQLTDEELRRHAEDFALRVTGAVRTR